ncbi:protein Wnt-2 isoform X2 [Anopheles bellator]|uniref:protein Wnt-2 isoform X2 n=1 Tax=Anopheles bellator TaxID=139047 RepID=UPI0026498942|nr:protein Wnt-2 isoform X2 [Anopheles bellator]
MRHVARELFIIFVIFKFRIATSFVSTVLCSRIPGLTPTQRLICAESPDAVLSLASGQLLGASECQTHFREHRWNCTQVWKKDMFGQVVVIGSKEAAYTYGITSAGAVYSITAACAKGNITSCGCDTKQKMFASSDLEIVKLLLRTECKCHGVSGSCAMKTCWKNLPSFHAIGSIMMKKYRLAKLVYVIPSTNHSARRLAQKRKRQIPQNEKNRESGSPSPKRTELVYLQASPNYCERNISIGVPGTVGRTCNRTSNNEDRCDLLCCGRGYNTHQNVRIWQCNCKFKWCCAVTCDICTEHKEEYTCK